jgi:hypothetical protein
MKEAVAAGIDIQGHRIRYAEVEADTDRYRLHRIDQRRMDFHAANELLRPDDSRRIDRIGWALKQMMEDGEATSLSLTVHPPDAYGFFTPIEADLPVRKRKLHLLQHAAIATGARSPKDFHLSTKTVRTAQDSEGEALMWVHVLAVPGVVHDRVGEMMDRLPVRSFSWMLSTEAASRVTSRIDLTGVTQEQALRPFTLAVGQYPGWTEFTLSRDRQWFHSHYAPRAQTVTDRAYYAVGLLNRLEVPLNSVGRLFIYGQQVEAEEYEPFESIFGIQPEPLDPFRAVQIGDTDIGSIEPTAFVPSIGAAME